MTTSDGYYSTYQARALIGAAVGGLCPTKGKPAYRLNSAVSQGFTGCNGGANSLKPQASQDERGQHHMQHVHVVAFE